MTQTRIAVVGTGHLGRIHARLINEVEGATLIGIVDPIEEARTRVAAEANTAGFASVHDLPDDLDAVIIATPTRTHHDIADYFLARGVHTFVEKPLALDVEQADRMVASANRAGCVLQVGHVERFNPAIRAAAPHLTGPRLIESTRESGYTFRSTDIGVVHDLMIHDIDLALWLTQSEAERVEASGMIVVGPHEDMAQACLTMKNGCRVVLKASRTAACPTRHARVFAERAYADIDYAAGEVYLQKPGDILLSRETAIQAATPDERVHLKETYFSKVLATSKLCIEECNAILEEQREFIYCIQQGATPTVCGEQARNAVAVAEQILAQIAVNSWDARDAVVAEQFNASPVGVPIPLPPLAVKPHRKAG